MNKKSTLIVLLGSMIVLNLAMLAFIFFSEAKGPQHNKGSKGNTESFIQEEFGFNEEQISEFKKSKAEHIKSIGTLNKQIQKESIKYYQLVSDQTDKDSLLQVVTDLSRSFYLSNDKHIQEMRALCSPEKEEALERFIRARINNDSRKRDSNNRPPPRK